MRLWSIHPKYLDRQGLLALWREGLLAQKVLDGRTRGYMRHPQLQRFRDAANPMEAIGAFLLAVWEEALSRGYRFDKDKILHPASLERALHVYSGQLEYELEHLKRKLQKRAPDQWSRINEVDRPEPHPLFVVREHEGLEEWERTA